MDYLFSDKLSKLELEISKEILKNIEKLEDLSITDLSNNVHASPATITKYTKKLGFSGFKQLKYQLISDINKSDIECDYVLNQKNKIEDFFKYLNMDKLNELASVINSSSYVCLYGKGPSLYVCKYFAPRIKALSNIPVLVYEDEQMLDIELENINDDKTIIFLSASLKTSSIIERVKKAKVSTKNFFLICEDLNELGIVEENKVIKLTSFSDNHNYNEIRDRTLFYIYLELLIETLKKK